MVPLAGLIDVAAEHARLTKEVARKADELARVEGKLGNADFIAKAPEAVVAKQRQKAEEVQTALVTLRSQLDSLNDL
jgi:valyl-tRNA synthetase